MPTLLTVSAADLGRCRFVCSPLWETGQAVHALTDPRQQPYHRRWLAEVAPSRPLDGLDDLLAVTPRRGYAPDFLAAPGSAPELDLDAELAAVRATPLDRVAAELAACLADGPDPARRRRLAGLAPDPAAALIRLTDQLRLAWERLVAPYWPRILALVRADIAHRARVLADGGLGEVVAGLHRRVRWQGDVIEVDEGVDQERSLGGAGLVLLPSAFVWPLAIVVLDGPGPPTLVYPARGVGDLWAEAAPPEAALARLLGRTRAVLLAGLTAPTATTVLAARTGRSAAGVSAHLAVLRDAGLVTATRVGHEVRYRRTPLGEAVLAGRDPSARP